jgi:hypothetical protein
MSEACASGWARGSDLSGRAREAYSGARRRDMSVARPPDERNQAHPELPTVVSCRERAGLLALRLPGEPIRRE